MVESNPRVSDRARNRGTRRVFRSASSQSAPSGLDDVPALCRQGDPGCAEDLPLVRTWPAVRGAAPSGPHSTLQNIVVAETSMVKSMELTFQTFEFTHSLLGHAA